MSDQIKEKTWEEFRNSNLLWWVNRSLHLFGWAIVLQYGYDDRVKRVYPARVRYRGFPEAVEEEGFKKLSEYMQRESGTLVAEASE